MNTTVIKKSRINLEDYDYQTDLCYRLFVQNISNWQRELLEDIINGPLQFSILELNSNFKINQSSLTSFLDKLKHSGLLSISGDLGIIDKEKRKLVEIALEPFDPDFKPDFFYLKNQLKKVPMHILPIWYSLPKNCNSLFLSIIEKYLQTPQIYERYLSELSFENPILDEIHQRLFKATQIKLNIEDLRNEFSLTEENMEKILMQLEWNLSGCVSFEKTGNQYIQIITPFYEYENYKQHFIEHKPQVLNPAKISLFRKSPHTFLQDIAQIKKNHLINHDILSKQLDCSQEYSYFIIESLVKLSFLEKREIYYQFTPQYFSFLQLTNEEQAIAILRFSNAIESIYKDEIIQEKAFKEIQKSIRSVVDYNFVLFNDFIKLLTISMGDKKGVILRNQGARFLYQFPTYDQVEIQYIKLVITQTLFQAGVVEIGFFNKELCFRLTEFGKSLFGAL